MAKLFIKNLDSSDILGQSTVNGGPTEAFDLEANNSYSVELHDSGIYEDSDEIGNYIYTDPNDSFSRSQIVTPTVSGNIDLTWNKYKNITSDDSLQDIDDIIDNNQDVSNDYQYDSSDNSWSDAANNGGWLTGGEVNGYPDGHDIQMSLSDVVPFGNDSFLLIGQLLDASETGIARKSYLWKLTSSGIMTGVQVAGSYPGSPEFRSGVKLLNNQIFLIPSGVNTYGCARVNSNLNITRGPVNTEYYTGGCLFDSGGQIGLYSSGNHILHVMSVSSFNVLSTHYNEFYYYAAKKMIALGSGRYALAANGTLYWFEATNTGSSTANFSPLIDSGVTYSNLSSSENIIKTKTGVFVVHGDVEIMPVAGIVNNHPSLVSQYRSVLLNNGNILGVTDSTSNGHPALITNNLVTGVTHENSSSLIFTRHMVAMYGLSNGSYILFPSTIRKSYMGSVPISITIVSATGGIQGSILPDYANWR